MTQPFMNAYVQLLIKTCHKRGALAWECVCVLMSASEGARERAGSVENQYFFSFFVC